MGRRNFLSRLASLAAFAGILTSPVVSLVSSAVAGVKKVLIPRGTSRDALIDKNPGHLDPRNLDLTPLKEFETMGLSDHRVSLERWRLRVEGKGMKPFSFTYDELLAMPALEKKVLLICPGVFANYGNWKGVSLRTLLRKALPSDSITLVTLSGPEGSYTKTETFDIKEVMAEKIFLAYAVNGEYLPVKHGYPLRVVAEGHYGYEWVKYVDHISAEIRNPG